MSCTLPLTSYCYDYTPPLPLTITVSYITMDFEDEREANVARNRALLMEFNLEHESSFMVRKKAPPKQKQKTQKKRKEAPSNDDDENVKPPRKAAALVASTDGDASAGPRRSGRNAGKKIDYAGDGDNLRRNNGPQVLTERARVKESEGQKGTMKRVHDPCVATTSSAFVVTLTRWSVQKDFWCYPGS